MVLVLLTTHLHHTPQTTSYYYCYYYYCYCYYYGYTYLIQNAEVLAEHLFQMGQK